MNPDRLLDICGAALDCFHDPARRDDYFAMYSDDVVVHGCIPDPIVGKAALRSYYDAIVTAFPDARVLTQDRFAHDDRVVGRMLFQGTHTGDFLGVPPTGRPVEVPVITVLRFEGDLCVERWSSQDYLGLLIQVGAVPPLAPGG